MAAVNAASERVALVSCDTLATVSWPVLVDSAAHQCACGLHGMSHC